MLEKMIFMMKFKINNDIGLISMIMLRIENELHSKTFRKNKEKDKKESRVYLLKNNKP